jgi:hypothetical protein
MKTQIAAAPMDDYQAEGDFHTLSRAEEIKADAKRHGKALAHGKQKVAAMQQVVAPDADDKPGVKEKGEGTPAEEAADKKLPKRGARTATNRATATKRPVKVNTSSVI